MLEQVKYQKLFWYVEICLKKNKLEKDVADKAILDFLSKKFTTLSHICRKVEERNIDYGTLRNVQLTYAEKNSKERFNKILDSLNLKPSLKITRF